jgi:hypothetical protein
VFSILHWPRANKELTEESGEQNFPILGPIARAASRSTPLGFLRVDPVIFLLTTLFLESLHRVPLWRNQMFFVIENFLDYQKSFHLADAVCDLTKPLTLTGTTFKQERT